LKTQASTIQKKKSQVQLARLKNQGHIEKFSGDTYKSSKGKGDVLKAGKLEPFSYIQLNPALLNKRKKQQAINSFSKVVTFGKKVDKKTDKRSALSGLKVINK
jgi:ribosomal RNA-processing protein 12